MIQVPDLNAALYQNSLIEYGSWRPRPQRWRANPSGYSWCAKFGKLKLTLRRSDGWTPTLLTAL